MNKLKRNEGPWYVHGALVESKNQGPICRLDSDTPSLDKGNGDLIAAAPDLLEALEEAVEILRQYGGMPSDPFKYDKIIAKAKGENQ